MGVPTPFLRWHGDCKREFGKIAKPAMDPLALQPILSNLNEAHEELARLFARIQLIVFGEIVDESVKGWAGTVATILGNG